VFACFFFSLAIGISRRESTVFVFTDASAKDENREGELVTAARHKDIKVTSLLTGIANEKKKQANKNIISASVNTRTVDCLLDNPTANEKNARHKDIKVTSLLTGYCRSGWRRRRRETHGILIFLFINHIRILGGRMASWP
jgi:hypothetical protein